MTDQLFYFYKRLFRKQYSAPEAHYLALRSLLLEYLIVELKKQNCTQKEAAKKLGVRQPRISEVYRGSYDKFSMELLVMYLSKFDKKVKLTIAGDSPVKERSSSIKSTLLECLISELRSHNCTQQEAAKKLGVRQPRIAEIYRASTKKMSAELLVTYLFKLGKEVTFTIEATEN